MKSICLFGDSIGKGVILDTIRGRYKLLKNSFANLFSTNTGVSVKNYSKFGCTITKGKELIDSNLDKINNFEFTVLEFGGNDCDFDWSAISEFPDQQHNPNTELDKFESCYSEIIDNVISAGSRPVLLTLPPLSSKKYFSWISKDRNAENILKWLGEVEQIYRWHEMYSLTVARLAAEKNVLLLDIRGTFLKVRDYFNLLCDDGIHPNEKGHQLIFNVLKEYTGKISHPLTLT